MMPNFAYPFVSAMEAPRGGTPFEGSADPRVWAERSVTAHMNLAKEMRPSFQGDYIMFPQMVFIPQSSGSVWCCILANEHISKLRRPIRLILKQLPKALGYVWLKEAPATGMDQIEGKDLSKLKLTDFDPTKTSYAFVAYAKSKAGGTAMSNVRFSFDAKMLGKKKHQLNFSEVESLDPAFAFGSELMDIEL